MAPMFMKWTASGSSRVQRIIISQEPIMRSFVFVLAGFISLAASTAQAGDYKVGSLQVANPWSRATPKGATVAAGYMKIANTGTEPDRLVGGSSDVATSFQIHEMRMEKGVAKMRPLTKGLEIKHGQTVEFAPNSFHIMFAGLKRPLAAGDHIKATLMFEKAGPLEVEFDVQALGATPDHAKMPGMQHGH
jgi:copper(I)-binding protein